MCASNGGTGRDHSRDLTMIVLQSLFFQATAYLQMQHRLTLQRCVVLPQVQTAVFQVNWISEVRSQMFVLQQSSNRSNDDHFLRFPIDTFYINASSLLYSYFDTDLFGYFSSRSSEALCGCKSIARRPSTFRQRPSEGQRSFPEASRVSILDSIFKPPPSISKSQNSKSVQEATKGISDQRRSAPIDIFV